MGFFFSHKEQSYAICRKGNEIGDNYIKQIKLDSERQILQVFSFVVLILYEYIKLSVCI